MNDFNVEEYINEVRSSMDRVAASMNVLVRYECIVRLRRIEHSAVCAMWNSLASIEVTRSTDAKIAMVVAYLK
jgi:hypothetical protein